MSRRPGSSPRDLANRSPKRTRGARSNSLDESRAAPRHLRSARLRQSEAGRGLLVSQAGFVVVGTAQNLERPPGMGGPESQGPAPNGGGPLDARPSVKCLEAVSSL